MSDEHVWLCFDCANRIRGSEAATEEIPALVDGTCPVCGGTTPLDPNELE